MRILAILLLAAAPLAAQITPSLLPSGPGSGTGVDGPRVPTFVPREAIAFNAVGETVLSPRIKQVTRLHNTLPHKLTGIGIVTGLTKSNGASDRASRLAMLNMIRQNGLNVAIQDVVGGSTTLVMLSCELPPFAKIGTELDVHVSSITDSVSLRGGYLQRSELRGVDNELYVVASGPLTAPGFVVGNDQAKVEKNATSVTADLVGQGLVVRENPSSYYSESGAIEFRLNNPTPFNAMSVGKGIERALEGTAAKVSVVDMTLVRIELPEELRTEGNANELVSFVGEVRVPVENPAKIVIDQAAGTVLAGEGVLISPCVVGLSDITVAVTTDTDVSQPNPLSTGTTERVDRSNVEVTEHSQELRQISGGATVADLLANLKALGMKPSQLVNVFVTLHKAGFLHAELEVR